jgi:DNA-directed RNA polymerase I subunit RPA2
MSNLANLIPMPDNNQSPRNMYQCQMGKQTMGTPCHNYHQQSGSKLYRLQTPAAPLFRPVHYDNVDMDDFPMGTNAIVAVISYTVGVAWRFLSFFYLNIIFVFRVTIWKMR